MWYSFSSIWYSIIWCSLVLSVIAIDLSGSCSFIWCIVGIVSKETGAALVGN